MATAEADALAELLAESYDDPGLFHEAILGRAPLYPKQEAIARSVCENRYTVVPTAHAMGKTWAAPSTVLHWLYTRPNGMVVTTSPSNTQLVNALWGGIRKAHAGARFPLAGRITEGGGTPQQLSLDPKWYAIGWAAKKPESFQGQRPDDGELLVVVDEASGVEQPIFDAIESLGATSHLFLGNPIRSTGHFRTVYDLAAAGTPGYAGFNLSAFDSPYANLTDEEVRARGLPRGLATRSWIEKTRAMYGEGSLYWTTRVLARFPGEDHDQLLPPSWVDRCRLLPEPRHRPGPRYLAADIAKGTGRDRTVVVVADELGILALFVDNRTDVLGAAQKVHEMARAWGVAHERIVFDAGGWCGSDMERYLHALGIFDAVAYRGGDSGQTRYKNRRARSAWKLRRRLDPDRPRLLIAQAPPLAAEYPEIAGRGRRPEPPRAATQSGFHVPATPHWDDLRQELLEIRYSHGESKIELEKKEEAAKRLQRSPDLADALFMLASLWSDE